MMIQENGLNTSYMPWWNLIIRVKEVFRKSDDSD